MREGKDQVNLEQSRKPRKLEKEWLVRAAIQSYKVHKKINFSSTNRRSRPLNIREFRSLLKIHMMHKGIAFQMLPFWCLANCPFQLPSRSTTLLGITHLNPNKQSTKDHSSPTIPQCNKRWPTDSSFCLHVQHQSTIIMLHLRKLSIVRIFPRTAVHPKRSNFNRNFKSP